MQLENFSTVVMPYWHLRTYHQNKDVVVMGFMMDLVFQKIKVVADWSICCNNIHKILSINANLPFRLIFLCNTLIQHILSKVYWWEGYKSKLIHPLLRVVQQT